MPDPGVPSNRTIHTLGADGTIKHWLASPVWSAACEDLDQFLDPQSDPWGKGRWVLTNGPDVGPLKEELARAHPIDTSQPLPQIVEGQPVRWRADGTEYSGTWERVHTGWDGLVDWSQFCFTPEYRYALAATMIEVDQAEWRTIEVASTGPVALWLNGELIGSQTTVSYMEPQAVQYRVRIPSGESTIHVATWQVAFRECRHVVSVKILGLPVRVVIPSPGADEDRSQVGEAILSQIANPSWAVTGDLAVLQAPAQVAYRVRAGKGSWHTVLSDEQGKLAVPLLSRGDDGDATGAAAILSSGETIVEVGLDDPQVPLTVKIPLAILPTGNRERSEGDAAQWRAEVLNSVAGFDQHIEREPSIARALARYALAGDTPNTEAAQITQADTAAALFRINTRGDCADFEALALLLAWHTIPAEHWADGLTDQVRQALTGLKTWITQPGLDAMCYFTENHQLVWHSAQHLIGQTFADSVISVDGRTGAEHAAEGRQRAAAWIERKLAGGFSEFDSNAYLAIDSYALVTLIELSENDALRSAATTLLDKILVTLASNSFHGVHGAAHGRSYVHTLRSSRFEETSPILRLLGGVGSMNGAVLPVTALATAKNYEIPEVVRKLVLTPPDQWWGRQVYRGQLAFERDLLTRPYRSDLRVWRTPAVMLSSVQQYRSGLPGLQEHIWGATLGPEAQVFVTHPANADTGSSARPNAWAGHRVLPRVHQHKQVLIHIQRLTTSDPVQHTHLWFASKQFDEVVIEGDWLFARRGGGYVALATPGGVYPVRHGETAQQEWLSRSGGQLWVAVVGDSQDGEFSAWQAQIKATPLNWLQDDPANLGVSWHGAEHLEVSFEGPFLINGVPEGIVAGRIADDPHLANPAVNLGFGAQSAVVSWDGVEHTLDVGQAIRAAQVAQT